MDIWKDYVERTQHELDTWDQRVAAANDPLKRLQLVIDDINSRTCPPFEDELGLWVAVLDAESKNLVAVDKRERALIRMLLEAESGDMARAEFDEGEHAAGIEHIELLIDRFDK